MKLHDWSSFFKTNSKTAFSGFTLAQLKLSGVTRIGSIFNKPSEIAIIGVTCTEEFFVRNYGKFNEMNRSETTIKILNQLQINKN